MPYELNEEFDEAGKIYLWLFRVYQCMGRDNDAAVQAIAMLQEFSRRVDKAHHLRGQLHKAREKDSTDQQLKLNTELESANNFSEARMALSFMSAMGGSLGDWVISSDEGVRRDYELESLDRKSTRLNSSHVD